MLLLARNASRELNPEFGRYFKYVLHDARLPIDSVWAFHLESLFLACLRSGTIEAVKQTRFNDPRAFIEVAFYSQPRECTACVPSLVQYPIDLLQSYLDSSKCTRVVEQRRRFGVRVEVSDRLPVSWVISSTRSF